MNLMRTLSLSLVLTTAPAWAGEDPADIMRRSEKLHSLPFEHIKSRMVLQEKDGAPRERAVESWIDDRPSGARLRVRFSAPADVAGTGMLSMENPGGTDEQWLYLPAFKKTRRLGTAELGDRFVGTDFFNEDMKSREVDDYAYTMLPAEKIDGQDCYVIESKPKSAELIKESPYGKTLLWVRKDNLAIIRVRYFDRKLEPLKQLDAQKLKLVSKTAWRADETTVVDVRRKHRTTVSVTSRETTDIAADQFTRRALESE